MPTRKASSRISWTTDTGTEMGPKQVLILAAFLALAVATKEGVAVDDHVDLGGGLSARSRGGRVGHSHQAIGGELVEAVGAVVLAGPAGFGLDEGVEQGVEARRRPRGPT